MGVQSKFRNNKALLTQDGTIVKGSDLKTTYIAPGTWFDSELEARYYRDVLQPMMERGELADVELQPKYMLLEKFEKLGVKHQAITYSPDFKLIYPDGRAEAVDVKGYENDRFPLKRKMFDNRYREIPLIVLKYSKKYGGWITLEHYNKEKANEKKRIKEGGGLVKPSRRRFRG